jgi:hypothetical protein
MVLALILLSAPHTNRLPCGNYTAAYSAAFWRKQSIYQGVDVYSGSTVGPFGIAAYYLTNATDKNQISEAIITYLDGWYSGRLDDKLVQVVGVNTSLTVS